MSTAPLMDGIGSVKADIVPHNYINWQVISDQATLTFWNEICVKNVQEDKQLLSVVRPNNCSMGDRTVL